MSAFVIFQKPSEAYLLSDAACYTPDGTLAAIESKMYDLPAARTVFVVRGRSFAERALQQVLGEASSFDEVALNLPVALEMIAKIRDYAMPGVTRWASKHFEVTLLGWSDQEARPMAVSAWTTPAQDPDDPTRVSFEPWYRQFAPFKMPPAMCSIGDLDGAAALGRRIETVADFLAIDPVRDGVALMEAMRTRTFAEHPYAVIGGFVEMATATRGGVERAIVHRWDDVVGSRARTFPAAANDDGDDLLPPAFSASSVTP